MSLDVCQEPNQSNLTNQNAKCQKHTGAQWSKLLSVDFILKAAVASQSIVEKFVHLVLSLLTLLLERTDVSI